MKKYRLYMILLAAVILVISAALLMIRGNSRPDTTAPETEATKTTQPVTETKTSENVQPVTESETTETVQPAAETEATETVQPAAETDQPFLLQITEDDPSIAYVLVRLQNGGGLLPLPFEGEYTKTIRQIADDNTESINVLHLTKNGFRMEDANCEGHDCINEGEVTLENREERVLWNMVVCLPHQLVAELITREEALSMFGQKNFSDR